MCWLIFIAIVALILFLVWASADVGSGIYLRSLCRETTSERVVTLTFDDGPDEEMTPKVLDILLSYDIKAIFFLIGKKAEQYPEIVKRIAAEGHIIGNHTYSHSGRFPLGGRRSIQEEIEHCGDVIAHIIGRRPTLFRPPFGVTNPTIGGVVRQLGLKSIGWSIRSLDTVERRSREDVCDKILSQLDSGAIILLHDRCKDADALLQRLIPAILERGYKFSDMSNLTR